MQSVKLHPKLLLHYTEREDGNVDKRFGKPEGVRQARKSIFKHLNVQPYQIIEAAQVHGDRILKLDPENTKMWRGHNITGVDGFVTDQPNVYLMLRIADCVPLVMFDPLKRALAVVHAGWRGTVKHIHLKALERLQAEYDVKPSQVLVWFGPAAHACHFYAEQEPEQKSDPQWKSFIKKRANRWYIDLIGYQTQTLNQAGIYKKNMTIDPQCTIETESLYSHLRSKDTPEPEGRFAVLVKMLS